jgi:uncharacterized protein YlzI (FlbEa/FlbD family)
VIVPDVLVPYMNGKKFIPFPVEVEKVSAKVKEMKV